MIVRPLVSLFQLHDCFSKWEPRRIKEIILHTSHGRFSLAGDIYNIIITYERGSFISHLVASESARSALGNEIAYNAITPRVASTYIKGIYKILLSPQMLHYLYQFGNNRYSAEYIQSTCYESREAERHNL